ncbi:hypothetical protein HPB50_022600 [Hyalomma asiaticum]|uniref:Uncharacterized protein n=1 Tax=Hyalomma asiaticum TaxID=266040 RepID=A0ACB7SB62_HYAAI|nr:hypothetical protein HPB50_022600 [Hyalomma asiaticum]
MCSGCVEPVASSDGENPTAAATVLPPLPLDSSIEPQTEAHTTEDQAPDTDICEERKFVVFESCLRQLLPVARTVCHRRYHTKLSVVGSVVKVRSSCDHCGHVTSWQSQPLIGDQPAGV